MFLYAYRITIKEDEVTIKGENDMNKEDKAKVLELLSEEYPDAHCQLQYKDPFQLLIAVMLSAQCTDKRVNMVTSDLFKRCTEPEDFIRLGEVALGEQIKPCGLYKNKSKNIIETCKILMEEHGGVVPKTMQELTRLPGVGRKTASVVLSNAFGVPAMPVDTHVFRVANRIGLAKAPDVEKTEKQLMEGIQKDFWIKAHHLLIYHGRKVCYARNPGCIDCRIKEYCDFTKQAVK